MEKRKLTIVDIVAAREQQAIEDDRRALEVARKIVETEPGPWTRLGLMGLIMERAGVRPEIAAAAEDVLELVDESLVETSDWQLVRKPRSD